MSLVLSPQWLNLGHFCFAVYFSYFSWHIWKSADCTREFCELVAFFSFEGLLKPLVQHGRRSSVSLSLSPFPYGFLKHAFLFTTGHWTIKAQMSFISVWAVHHRKGAWLCCWVVLHPYLWLHSAMVASLHKKRGNSDPPRVITSIVQSKAAANENLALTELENQLVNL